MVPKLKSQTETSFTRQRIASQRVQGKIFGLARQQPSAGI